MLLPAVTVALPVLLTATSACGVTVVLTWEPMLEPSLLAGTGSPVLEVAEAVLVNAPLAGAFTVKIGRAAGRVGGLVRAGQLTLLPVSTPPLEALTKVTFRGRASLTTTLLAVEGPRLVMVMV